MSETQKPDPGRSADRTASSIGAEGLPARRKAYLRPQLTQTDLRKALSDVGEVDDGLSQLGKVFS